MTAPAGLRQPPAVGRPTTPAGAGTARRRPRRHGWLALPWALLCMLALSTVYPIVFVAFTAFRTPQDYANNSLGAPLHPTTQYLGRAWRDGQVARLSWNSLVVVVAAVALVVLAATLAGWALASMRFPLRRLALLGVIGMMMLPASVLMIPIFGVVRDLGLVNHRLGLVLVYASLHTPFATYLLTSYMQGIPRELEEAATCDGAGPVRVFWQIAVPISRPAILTVVTLTFLWLWNELLFGLLILQDPANRMLMVGLATLQGQSSTEVPLLAAGMLLTMLPALGVFVLFQRNLAVGITAGSVK